MSTDDPWDRYFKEHITSATAALSDAPEELEKRLEVTIDNEAGRIGVSALQPRDRKLFERAARERGISVEELLQQAVDDYFNRLSRLLGVSEDGNQPPG
ncbi:hypothetical protein [Mycobacterium sp.]|uniref:hypothetical protein n=1 Tax=Mycobacterium sp. TaxID=1785 RepID=UPI003F94413B